MSTQKIEGWRLVPVEPTAEMLDVKHVDGYGYAVSADEYYFSDRDSVHGFMRYVYSRMLAAAPACQSAAAAPKWISVDERLPDPETDVLVCNPDCYGGELLTAVAGLFHGVWMSQETEDNLRFDPTHWMPLPAPPTT